MCILYNIIYPTGNTNIPILWPLGTDCHKSKLIQMIQLYFDGYIIFIS